MTKNRIVASSQLLLRLDQGSTQPIDGPSEDTILSRLTELQSRWPRVLVADSRRLEVYRDVGLTAAKPNYDEAVALLGNAISDGRPRTERMARHGERLLHATGAKLVALTLDSDGAILFEPGRPPDRTYAQAVRSACVAGAGDIFTSALAMALAAGASAAGTSW